MSKNKSIIVEIWAFMKQNKAWWIAPIVIILILFGILVTISQSSPLSPFIYALF